MILICPGIFENNTATLHIISKMTIDECVTCQSCFSRQNNKQWNMMVRILHNNHINCRVFNP